MNIGKRWARGYIVLACLLLISQVNAATPTLPEGFPIDDVVSLGNNSYTSPTFGDFSLDPNVEKRVIHSVIGPFIWSMGDDKNVVILNSEWWGPLYVTAPGKTSHLGHMFPYAKSEYTGSNFFVVVSGNSATPFYNHGLGSDGKEIGWQSAIGIGLSDYVSHYKAAEGYVVEMQQRHHNMRVMRDQLAAAKVSPGSNNIENLRLQAINELELMNKTYTHFLFHFQRTTRAWVFVRKNGGTDQQVIAAQSWVSKAAAIHDIIYAEYVGAQRTISNEVEPIYASKAQERSNIGGTPSNEPSSGQQGSGSVPPVTGGTSGTTTPIVTAGDAIRWNQIDIIGAAKGGGVENFALTASLSDVNPHRGSYYGPPSWYLDLNLKGTESWTSYLPFGTGRPITGNLWIFVPQSNGRYWGIVFEGYSNQLTIHPAGNLNYDHTNVFAGTPLSSPWQPSSGTTYGWMVSTNVIWPGRNGNMRSNIMLQAWP